MNGFCAGWKVPSKREQLRADHNRPRPELSRLDASLLARRKNTMNETPGSTRMEEKRVRRALPFDGVPLVLQGGGALGAYKAGVFQAICEANIEVSWVCGTSIGAVNGALIVGNPPERRVKRLREFWETITTPPVNFLNIPWFSPVSLTENPQTRYWANKMSILTTMMQGTPG